MFAPGTAAHAATIPAAAPARASRRIRVKRLMGMIDLPAAGERP